MEDNKYVTEKEERLAKLQEILKTKNAYAGFFDKTHDLAAIHKIKDAGKLRDFEAVTTEPKSIVKTAGRLISRRDHGKLIFADLLDATGRIQICFKKDLLPEEDFKFLELVDQGDFIGVEGEPFITKTGQLTIMAIRYELLSKAIRPLPAQFYGLKDTESRYRQRYLDLILDDEAYRRMSVRFDLVQRMREWLRAKSFVEVSTRILQPEAGGAQAEAFYTHHNALDHDFAIRISPELDLKMAIAGRFERVFEFAKNFRNEGIDPSHLQEFEMLEWYCAYKNYLTGIEWTESLIKDCVGNALGKKIFQVYDREGNLHDINLDTEFEKIKFKNLMANYKVDVLSNKEELVARGVNEGLPKEELEKKSRAGILDEIYKKVVRPHIIQPTFVLDYPADLVPLARPKDEDPSYAESYQLVIASWEVVKGYSELVDPIQQRRAFEIQAKAKTEGDKEAMSVNEEFLSAMEHGMPPITGCGIGIDRLVSLITLQKNIKESVLFPLVKPDDSYDYI